MLNKTKEKTGIQSNDPLMKPFILGWRREVVNRVITKNRNLSCDIYYFSPNGKRIRSMPEIKSNLTDGLTPECFSFKRHPLGVNEKYEKVRDARVNRRGNRVLNERSKSLRGTLTTDSELKVGEEQKKNNKYNKVSKHSEERRKRVSNSKDVDESNRTNKMKIKTKGKKLGIHNVDGVSRKEVLKKVMNVKKAKKTKVSTNKRILKEIITKTESPKKKLAKTKKRKKTALKSKSKTNALSKIVNKTRHQTTKKIEEVKEETVSNEPDNKLESKDLRSIVKKNIGKYREMREKQKLNSSKQQKNTKSKVIIRNISRARSEPISKNKQLYLKPFEKGWKRELVFRKNSTRAGQYADVYYFHPSGKKLRSTREIAENLTHGMSIEYFTFRKEPIGCGEPLEVIRQAKSHSKL